MCTVSVCYFLFSVSASLNQAQRELCFSTILAYIWCLCVHALCVCALSQRPEYVQLVWMAVLNLDCLQVGCWLCAFSLASWGVLVWLGVKVSDMVEWLFVWDCPSYIISNKLRAWPKEYSTCLALSPTVLFSFSFFLCIWLGWYDSDLFQLASRNNTLNNREIQIHNNLGACSILRLQNIVVFCRDHIISYLPHSCPPLPALSLSPEHRWPLCSLPQNK